LKPDLQLEIKENIRINIIIETSVTNIDTKNITINKIIETSVTAIDKKILQ